MSAAKTATESHINLLPQEAIEERSTQRWSAGTLADEQLDLVSAEVPVALVYNGISFAVMMATPLDLEAFAVGFSLSEGIVESTNEIQSIDVVQCKLDSTLQQGFEVVIEINQRRAQLLKERRRNLSGRTGCGLCGTESLAGAIRPINQVAPKALPQSELIDNAVRSLRDHQPLQQQTGSLHAAAWCLNDGSIQRVFEDVGRHNAVDKLIGALSMEKTAVDTGFMLVSSRGSYEIIHKVAAAGISTLVTISAPTALACDLAAEAGLNLVGFARNGKHTIYNRVLAE